MDKNKKEEPSGSSTVVKISCPSLNPIKVP